jgi:hypothetical protein
MNITMVRAKVKPESVAETETSAKWMFSAINQAKPAGVGYASFKLADGETFVAILALEDPANNPLNAIPEVTAFLESLKDRSDRFAEPPVLEQLTVVGSYGFFEHAKTPSVS